MLFTYSMRTSDSSGQRTFPDSMCSSSSVMHLAAAPPGFQALICLGNLHGVCAYTCRYIYNHKACGRCGTSVRTWDMYAPIAYAC